MREGSHIPDLDDEGQPFDEDTYFAKMGFTKAERKESDKWENLRSRFRAGGIAHDGMSMLDARPADEWVKQTDDTLAEPRKFFGDFWLEGELCILFADTAKGKSILAVQIAESIARKRPIDPFEMTADGTILYLDFELNRAQFTHRYSGVTTPQGIRIRDRKFHPNFIRCQIENKEVPPAFRNIGEFLAHSINVEVRRWNPRVLIIDNISWLRTSNTNASSALELMRELKALKQEEKLSILVLAHTPKRPFARPLTVNDLAGSKMLANFADSIFAIGDSIHGNNIRYLKQVKPRSTPLIYDATNVAVARIEKPSNFLKFTFTNFANEAEHLIRSHFDVRNLHVSTAEHDDLIQAGNKQQHENDPSNTSDLHALRQSLVERCKDLRKNGLSLNQIANQLGISKATADRYCKA